jgi:hypothetical protein
MLKLCAALLIAGPLTACAVDSVDPAEGTDSSFPTADPATKLPDPLPPISADQEYGFFQGQTFTFTFPGFFTPQAETFFIWNLGTSIQHDAPYPSNDHGRLYAVFAPGPAGSTHHVAGQDGFDHYHVMSQNAGTRTFDVFLVFTGPNYNAATFDAPLSEKDVNRAVADGVLGPVLKTTDAGFDPLVFTVPVTKFKGH